jgi:hypothetical protein
LKTIEIKINSGQTIKIDEEDVAKTLNINLFITVDRPNRVHFRYKKGRARYVFDRLLVPFKRTQTSFYKNGDHLDLRKCNIGIKDLLYDKNIETARKKAKIL